MKLKLLTIAITAALLLSACGNPPTAATPGPPNSPQAAVLNLDKTMADAINAAVKTAITLRDQGKLSQANTATVENWGKFASIMDDSIATELGSADTWAVQKAKIFDIIVTIIPVIPNADPSLASALNIVGSLLAQIKTQVSQ